MLLFDENLSRRLVPQLADLFRGSVHVSSVGLDRADDVTIWAYAAEYGLTIVTKDSDFIDLGLLRGFPPRIVRIRSGNCSTDAVARLLRDHAEAIREMDLVDTGALDLY